jgi:hypothetical protein
MKIILQALLLASLAASAAAQCSLCPTDSVLGNPDLQVPISDALTCADYETALLSLTFDNESEECDGFRNPGIDYPAYCGCSGVDPPNSSCSFCGSDDMVIDLDRPIDDDDPSVTCGDVNILAPFITDTDTCSSIQQAIPLCCVGGRACGVCADLGEPGNPDNPLDDASTCEDLDMILGRVPADQCAGLLDEFDDFAVGAYCGCAGENTIPDKCALCPEGEDVARPNARIPDIGLTCAEGQQFARFFTVCDGRDIAEAAMVCGCPKGGKKGSKKGSKKGGKKGSKKEGKKGSEKGGKKGGKKGGNEKSGKK